MMPQHKAEFVTIERSQFDTMIQRIEALETRVGIPQIHQLSLTIDPVSEFDAEMQCRVAAMTRQVLGADATVEQMQDDEERSYRVVVRIVGVDPREVSAKRSDWHDHLVGLDLPKNVIDNIRLKVIYE